LKSLSRHAGLKLPAVLLCARAHFYGSATVADVQSMPPSVNAKTLEPLEFARYSHQQDLQDIQQAEFYIVNPDSKRR
jgi:hypothetical protein